MVATEDLILTPSARLARTLQQSDTEQRANQGIVAWQRPSILPLTLWLQTLQTELFIGHDHIPRPLPPAQARLMWQYAIAQEVYVGHAGLAKLAQQTWRWLHEYECPLPDAWQDVWLNDDQRAFRRWAKVYQIQCQTHRCLDFAAFLKKLPTWCADGWLTLPQSITLTGFNIEPAPIYLKIFEAMKSVGVDIQEIAAPSLTSSKDIELTQCRDTQDEVIRAAHWARQQIEAHPEHRVAIVIPNLERVLAPVEKNLKAIFDPPAFCLDKPSLPTWHISLGHPLAKTPLIADALHLLELSPHQLTQAQVGRLLRSPWIRGWLTEARQRHQLILRLNDNEPYWLDMGTVIRQAKALGCVSLAKQLSRWHTQRLKSPPVLSADQWAEQFQQELSTLGFGFGRTLDRVEYQTLEHWHQTLEQFADLEAIQFSQTMRTPRNEAVGQLTELCGEVLFREQDLGAPVAVMGPQEALGSVFDAVWLVGLDHETWPSAPKRDPLIPKSLQKHIPFATAEGCLRLARQQLMGLICLAPHVRGSYPLGDDALPLKPTRLLSEWIPVWTADSTATPPLIEQSTIELDQVANDIQAPQVDEALTLGGVHLLNAQSACPFKAFAVYRLKAQDHREPQPGISAKDRGTLIHNVLQAFWEQTKTSTELAELSDEALRATIHTLVEKQISQFLAQHPKALDSTSQKLELDNLCRKLEQWLNFERQRPPFQTKHLEEPVMLSIGPLTLKAKPDRIDELQDGSQIVIDYKTGRVSKSDWTPLERIRDGQLPAYALTASPAPIGVSFAKIGRDEIRFDGFAAYDLQISGISAIDQYKKAPFKEIETWPNLLTRWKEQLTGLSIDYQQGHAAVDPAKPNVCRYCHLKSLCRIRERGAWFDDSISEDDASNEVAHD